MNQPTKEQFEELKKRVEELERQTEPIKVTRIEIEQKAQDALLQKIFETVGYANTDIGVLKHEMLGLGQHIRRKSNEGDKEDSSE